MKEWKRLVVRTVIGLKSPDVEHRQDELIMSFSPEHYSMFRKRARAAGKTMEDYFMQDMIGLPPTPAEPPVPYEIVEQGERPPVCPWLASTIAAYPEKLRKGMLKRIQAAVKVVGLPFTQFLQCAVSKALQEIEATGEIRLGGWQRPLVSSPKLNSRLAEIDERFGFEVENGFTEWMMRNMVNQVKDGDWDLLCGGYEFKDLKAFRRSCVSMVSRWRTEDGLPPLKFPRVAKVERRAA